MDMDGQIAKIEIVDGRLTKFKNFDSQIQSFNARRLIFWILSFYIPISHFVNWPQTLQNDLTYGIEKARN